MYADSPSKFGFRIRTKQGALVENLLIQGRDASDAQRKLQQMYPRCEVIECTQQRGVGNQPLPSFEELVNLITR